MSSNLNTCSGRRSSEHEAFEMAEKGCHGQNQDLRLYHGTVDVHVRIGPGGHQSERIRPFGEHSDFGPGFYTTTVVAPSSEMGGDFVRRADDSPVHNPPSFTSMIPRDVISRLEMRVVCPRTRESDDDLLVSGRALPWPSQRRRSLPGRRNHPGMMSLSGPLSRDWVNRKVVPAIRSGQLPYTDEHCEHSERACRTRVALP